jgi:hypothetical protein
VGTAAFCGSSTDGNFQNFGGAFTKRSLTNVNDYAPCPLLIDADGIVYYTPGGDGSPWEGMSFDGISFLAA